MRKTCTECGSQEFYAEIDQQPTMPRKPSLSGEKIVVTAMVCTECGESYSQ